MKVRQIAALDEKAAQTEPIRATIQLVKARSALVSAMAAFLLFAALEAPALGCSCNVGTAKDLIKITPASFIGRLESFRPLGDSFGRGRYRYSVKQSFERDLGSSVILKAGIQTTACGLPKKVGKKIALGLTGKPGNWASGMCYRTSISGLRAAAKDESFSGSRAPMRQCGGAAKAVSTSVARLTDALDLS